MNVFFFFRRNFQIKKFRHKASQFRFVHDENSGLNFLKIITGAPIENGNKFFVFNNGLYFRHEFKGDLS